MPNTEANNIFVPFVKKVAKNLEVMQICSSIGGNVGGMVSCRLRAPYLSIYTELQAGGNASN